MRKIILAALAMVIGATCADAAVYRVAEKTIVKKHPNGLVQVIGSDADLVNFNYLGQHCPDRFRVGCDDDIPVPALKREPGSVWFQRDVEGMKRGQISFNFMSGKDFDTDLWLGIPDCNVIPDGFIWEISKKDPDNKRSGGTQFTDAFPGYIPLHREIKWDELCGEPVKVSTPAPVVAPPVRTVAPAPAVKPCPTDGGVSKNSDSTIGANIKSPQAAAVGIGNAWTAGNVKIGANNKGPIYAPNKQKIYAPQYKAGNVNKNNKAPVYNGSIRQNNFFTVNVDGHKGVDPRSDCTRCHNQGVVDEDKRDTEAFEVWKKNSEEWRAWNKACQENPTSAKCKEGEPKPSKSKYK